MTLYEVDTMCAEDYADKRPRLWAEICGDTMTARVFDPASPDVDFEINLQQGDGA
jgi:hypothetical protein